jgi:hypothetical protein
MNTRLKQLFHGDVSQNTSLLNCILCGRRARSGLIPCSAPGGAGGKILVPVINRPSPLLGTPERAGKLENFFGKKEDGQCPSCPEPYLLLNWKRLRAPFSTPPRTKPVRVGDPGLKAPQFITVSFTSC